VVLASGLTVGGREGAVNALAGFWNRVSKLAKSSPLQPSWYDRVIHNHGLEYSPGYFFFDMLSRIFSPYQLNPFNYNPIKAILEEVVDFESLRCRCAIKVFLSGNRGAEANARSPHHRRGYGVTRRARRFTYG
jgi:NTE family protein